MATSANMEGCRQKSTKTWNFSQSISAIRLSGRPAARAASIAAMARPGGIREKPSFSSTSRSLGMALIPTSAQGPQSTQRLGRFWAARWRLRMSITWFAAV
jgi:hypothetical protein